MEKSRGKLIERGNSFVGYRSRDIDAASASASAAGAIIVVDPFSTGAHLAVAISDKGIKSN